MNFNLAYCSDKYQYTMGKSFYERGLKDRTAIFNLFYRQAPDGNGWAVVSGVREVLEMISCLGKAEESFFEKFIPGDEYAEFRKQLSTLRFTGNVYAMREGEIAFPNQPVIIVEAPLIEAQLLETPMLCIMNHQMAIATKASRVTRATNKPVSEFGSRRAHGPWAAVYGGKAAYIAGCAGSSNILSAAMFGVPCSGTMAHSYTTSFGATIGGERKAFDSYIETHMGENLILLIDTFDTLKCGLPNAIKAFKAHGIGDDYAPGYGIRLDSGDLAYLSQKCRARLDCEGLSGCKIFATNSLDEYLIKDLELQNAKIDAYGVGDAIATSKHNPCFGNVYKLVQLGGEAVLKRSEDKIKLINPGFQITYRISRGGNFQADVTCLRGDDMEKALLAGKTVTIRNEFDETRQTTFQAGRYNAKPLQEQMISGGEPSVHLPDVNESRAYYKSNLTSFNPTQIRIINPHFYKCDISNDLYELKMKIIKTLNREIEEAEQNEITHIVVDELYDFIDGTLACANGEQAALNTAAYIAAHPDHYVRYVADCHPENHCSFKENGGIWPAHCVSGTRGGAIHDALCSLKVNAPTKANTFLKGCDPSFEQYSGFQAKTLEGDALADSLSKKVYVSGIATEYCIKNTCLDLLNAGHEVFLLKDCLAWVDAQGHKDTLKELSEKGVTLI